jgi:LysR substrate binding domain.
VRLLNNEPLILLHPQQRIRHVSDAILAKARITPNIVLILKTYETAQHLAGQGIGITF